MLSPKDQEKLASIVFYLFCAYLIAIPGKQPIIGVIMAVAYIIFFFGPFFYRAFAPEFIQVFFRRISNYVNNLSARTNYTLCVVMFILLLCWSWWIYLNIDLLTFSSKCVISIFAVGLGAGVLFTLVYIEGYGNEVLPVIVCVAFQTYLELSICAIHLL